MDRKGVWHHFWSFWAGMRAQTHAQNGPVASRIINLEGGRCCCQPSCDLSDQLGPLTVLDHFVQRAMGSFGTWMQQDLSVVYGVPGFVGLSVLGRGTTDQCWGSIWTFVLSILHL